MIPVVILKWPILFDEPKRLNVVIAIKQIIGTKKFKIHNRHDQRYLICWFFITLDKTLKSGFNVQF